MSESPPRHGPRAAYFEECHEESQDTIPGTKVAATANFAVKRHKRRDEASDSGYSSHTAATGDSSSQGSKRGSIPVTTRGLIRAARKMAGTGKKTQQEPQQEQNQPSAPKPSAKRGISRTQKKEDLRLEICETRDEAARMTLRGLAPPESPGEPFPSNIYARPLLTGPASPVAVRVPSAPIVPTQSIPIPRPATLRSHTTSTQAYHGLRPTSYLGVSMGESAYTHLPPPMPVAPPHQPSPMMVTPGYIPQSYPPPNTTYFPAPPPASPQRQVSYPFPPTTFTPSSYYPIPTTSWHPDGYQPSPPLRRTSFHSAHGSHIPEYPLVPPGYHAFNTQHASAPPVRRLSIHQMPPPGFMQPPHMMQLPPPPMPTPPPPPQQQQHPSYFPDDDPLFQFESESYYRAIMPPPAVPQRPVMRHAVSTNSAQLQHDPMRNSMEYNPSRTSMERYPSRNSLEYVSHSPRKQSLDEARPPSRPSTRDRPPLHSRPSQHSSTSNSNSRTLIEGPPSPSALRRLRPVRPVTYHGDGDLERQVEAYQAAKVGHKAPIPLTADAIQQAVKQRDGMTSAPGVKKGKTKRSSGGSEVGSRTGSRSGGSEVTRRKKAGLELQRPKTNEDQQPGAFSVRIGGGADVKLDLGEGNEGRTISWRHSKDGMGGLELSISHGAGKEKEKEKENQRSGGGPGSRDGGREVSRIKERGEDGGARERRVSIAGRREVREIKEAGERAQSVRRRSKSRAAGPGADGKTPIDRPHTVAPIQDRERSKVTRTPSTRLKEKEKELERSRARADARGRHRYSMAIIDGDDDDVMSQDADLVKRFQRLRAESISRNDPSGGMSARAYKEALLRKKEMENGLW